MSTSSNSNSSIIAGSIAVAGAFAAASLWSSIRRDSSKDSAKNNTLQTLTPTDSEKLEQVVNASLDYFHHDLPAQIIGDMTMVRKGTALADREDLVHHIINAFFKHFYMAKADKSVSTDLTEDSSVSSSDDSIDWADEEHVTEKAVKQSRVSGSDVAAMFIASTLVKAQGLA